MKRHTALEIAVKSMQKEAQILRDKRNRYLSDSNSEAVHRVTVKIIEINRAIEKIDSMRRQKELL